MQPGIPRAPLGFFLAFSLAPLRGVLGLGYPGILLGPFLGVRLGPPCALLGLPWFFLLSFLCLVLSFLSTQAMPPQLLDARTRAGRPPDTPAIIMAVGTNNFLSERAETQSACIFCGVGMTLGRAGGRAGGQAAGRAGCHELFVYHMRQS